MSTVTVHTHSPAAHLLLTLAHTHLWANDSRVTLQTCCSEDKALSCFAWGAEESFGCLVFLSPAEDGMRLACCIQHNRSTARHKRPVSQAMSQPQAQAQSNSGYLLFRAVRALDPRPNAPGPNCPWGPFGEWFQGPAVEPLNSPLPAPNSCGIAASTLFPVRTSCCEAVCSPLEPFYDSLWLQHTRLGRGTVRWHSCRGSGLRPLEPLF